MSRIPIEEVFVRYRDHGDARALAAVFDRTAAEVMRLAVHLAPDRSAAEDLVQSTFVAAIESADKFGAERPLMPWLLGILANQARRERERTGRKPDPHLLRAESVDDPHRTVEERELSEALAAALAEIRDPYRQVLELHLRHGLSPAAIADVLRRPPGTVRSQLHRGLDLVRRALPKSYAVAGATLAAGAWLQSPAAAAIRTHVLASASTTTAVPTALALGGFVVKKSLLAVAAIGLLATIAIVAWNAEIETSAPQPGASQPGPESTAPAAVGDAPDVERRTVDEPVAAPTAVAPAPTVAPARSPRSPGSATLDLTLRWKDDGSPAAGIGVRLLWVSPPAPKPRFGKSDAAGRLRFDELPAGYVQAMTLTGDARVAAGIESGAVRTRTLELERGMTVEGIVVTDHGAPVAGADIWIAMYTPQTGAVVARSDSDGTFRLEGIREGHTLAARKAGHGPSALAMVREFRTTTSENVRHCRLVLIGQSAAVEGVVVDGAGVAIEDATVEVRLLDRSAYARPDGWVLPPPPRRVSTDSSGRFAIRGLATGKTRIAARHPARAAITTERILEPNERARVELVLLDGVTVRGVVTDGAGEPVSHATVRYGAHGDFASRLVNTARDGVFELRGIPAGRFKLEASTMDQRHDAKTFEAIDGETIEWSPMLSRAGQLAIAGVVVDEHGEPRRTWGIKVRTSSSSRTTATDAKGRFRIDGLKDGVYSLEVREPMKWLEPPLRVLEDVRPSSRELTIEVATAQTARSAIRGRLLGSHGRVDPKATVRLWPQPLGRPTVAKLDGDSGAFAFEDLPASTYRITFAVPGGSHSPVTITTSPGETHDLGVIQAAVPGDVALFCVRSDGETIAGGRGYAVLESELQRLGRADTAGLVKSSALAFMAGSAHPVIYAKGAFRTRLAPGTYRLRMWGYNVAPFERTVRVQSGQTTELRDEVVAAQPREFRFVVDPDSAWPARLLFEVVRGNEIVHDVELQSPQRKPYRWRAGFEPGVYELRAETNTGASSVTSFRVEAGGPDKPITIELK